MDKFFFFFLNLETICSDTNSKKNACTCMILLVFFHIGVLKNFEFWILILLIYDNLL